MAISDVDTRALVSYIRDNGAQNAVISTDGTSIEDLKLKLAAVPNMKGLELASVVSTKEPYYFGEENATYKIAALDLGIKKIYYAILLKGIAISKSFHTTPLLQIYNLFNQMGISYQTDLEIPTL